MTKSVTKNDYACKRKHFDKCVKKAKRKFQLDEQKRLGEKPLNSDNPKECWRKIGEIGMANERKQKIPLEVIDDDGNLLTNKTEVINRWKYDYGHLYNKNDNTNFDSDHLNQIRQLLETSMDDGTIFSRADCSSLNMHVSREEVRQAVYKMKNGKASGIDELSTSRGP